MLPPSTDPVLLRDAAARGLTRGRLRGAAWEHVSHGLYAPAGAVSSPLDRARAVVSVLPRNSGYGHLTSAALRGWWLPHLVPTHVLLATTSSRVHVQRLGLYVRRSHRVEVEDVAGLPCVGAAQTLLELAADLSLVDLVPMIDAALAGGLPADAVAAAARTRRRGAVILRRALALADPRSESWWESVLRLQHLVTGLGPVASQVEIRDANRFVARADLHLVGTRRYPECDGGEHRDRLRHGHDLRRDRDLARLGLERYGYTTAEIACSPHVVIADAEEARGLAPDPRRLTSWWDVAMPSSLTASGRARLARRLDRYRRAADR